MKLPDAETAEVPEAKIVRYLLSLTHPEGRGKALFFYAFGFAVEKWERLADALREHARENDVAKVETTPFGTRYVVEGAMTAPDGRTPNVRVVWFVDSGETVPRFVTAYPLDATPLGNLAPPTGKERNNGTGTG